VGQRQDEADERDGHGILFRFRCGVLSVAHGLNLRKLEW
jgi:hypothetical protein